MCADAPAKSAAERSAEVAKTQGLLTGVAKAFAKGSAYDFLESGKLTVPESAKDLPTVDQGRAIASSVRLQDVLALWREARQEPRFQDVYDPEITKACDTYRPRYYAGGSPGSPRYPALPLRAGFHSLPETKRGLTPADLGIGPERLGEFRYAVGSDPDGSSSAGLTPIQTAIETGDLLTLKFYLDFLGAPVEVRSVHKSKPKPGQRKQAAGQHSRRDWPLLHHAMHPVAEWTKVLDVLLREEINNFSGVALPRIVAQFVDAKDLPAILQQEAKSTTGTCVKAFIALCAAGAAQYAVALGKLRAAGALELPRNYKSLYGNPPSPLKRAVEEAKSGKRGKAASGEAALDAAEQAAKGDGAITSGKAGIAYALRRLGERMEIVRMLVERGGDPGGLDSRQRAPLDVLKELLPRSDPLSLVVVSAMQDVSARGAMLRDQSRKNWGAMRKSWKPAALDEKRSTSQSLPVLPTVQSPSPPRPWSPPRPGSSRPGSRCSRPWSPARPTRAPSPILAVRVGSPTAARVASPAKAVRVVSPGSPTRGALSPSRSQRAWVSPLSRNAFTP